MTSRPVGQEGRCSLVVRLSRQFNGSFFTVHEIIAYNEVTRIWIYFIVVFGFNYLNLDRIRIFIKVNPLLSATGTRACPNQSINQ